MRPLQNVVDQNKMREIQRIAQLQARQRQHWISLVIIILSIASVVIGAGLIWGWEASVLAMGICCLPIGILLGLSNNEENR